MDPLTLTILALVGGALYLESRNSTPTVSDENDEGDSAPAAILDSGDTVDQTDTLEAEAWAHGASLGTFTFVGIGGGFYLRQDAAESFGRLKSVADTSEVTLQIDSAFRFMADQQALWARHQPGGDMANQAVARPGYSNHQSGIAIDIAVQSSNQSPTYLWLSINAPQFGFYNVGSTFNPPEWWHWEYNPNADLWAGQG